MSMSDGLVVSDLVVGYGKNQVVHGVSMEVRPGSRVALLGANGAGKTTLLRTISGVLRPKSGTISYEGEALNGRTTSQIVKRGVIQVPEGRRVFPSLTVRENLTVAAYGHHDRLDAGLERVFEAYPVLRERLEQPAGLLSGGQQQMLALGRAIVAQPRLLLLDEMSLGLAPILVKEFYATLPKVFSDDLTILIVEQNAKMAISVADYVYVLRNGVISVEGPSEKFRESEDLLHQGYLGVSATGAKL